MRQIILDTETTGISVEEGHRIIEVGCVEMINRKLTGRHFHEYLNPGREVDPGAFAVHGISNDFLKDKPSFGTIVDAFMDFVSGAELIIHNAPFDLSFINHELRLVQKNSKPVTHYCTVIDTLRLARQLHVGQRNSLDALCKRYGIDNSKRDLHGALLDAHLLARVYLAMTGGQGSFFDALTEDAVVTAQQTESSEPAPKQTYQLTVRKATEQEAKEHEAYLDKMKKQGKCLWE